MTKKKAEAPSPIETPSFVAAADIHGSAADADRLMELIDHIKPKMVILLGDLFLGGGAASEEDQLIEILSVMSSRYPTYFIRGNCDSYLRPESLPWSMDESVQVKLGPTLFTAMHGHQLWAMDSDLESSGRKANILSGHTHTPRAEKTPLGRRWNPGSLGMPKGGWPKTYGWYMKRTFNVLDLATGHVLLKDRLAWCKVKNEDNDYMGRGPLWDGFWG